MGNSNCDVGRISSYLSKPSLNNISMTRINTYNNLKVLTGSATLKSMKPPVINIPDIDNYY